MRLLVASAVAGLLALSPNAAWSEEKLFLYNWTDYTSPEAIKKFEAETGIKVTIDTYDSNETLLAKLKAGATGYDVIIPSHNFVPILIDEKLVQKYDAKALPNFANVEDRWKNPEWDKNQEYTPPSTGAPPRSPIVRISTARSSNPWASSSSPATRRRAA